jgi:hypothetical protein
MIKPLRLVSLVAAAAIAIMPAVAAAQSSAPSLDVPAAERHAFLVERFLDHPTHCAYLIGEGGDGVARYWSTSLAEIFTASERPHLEEFQDLAGRCAAKIAGQVARHERRLEAAVQALK